MKDIELIRDFYDEFAEEYNDSRIVSGGRLFNEYIEMPAVISLLPKVRNKSVLDIGCGVGAFCRQLRAKDAQITAIDISSKMLDKAKENCSDMQIEFIQSSFQDFNIDKKFDLIVGGFMLGYFYDLKEAFKKIYNLLKDKNSSCILSMIHPVKLSSISRDDGSYILGDYFNEDLMYKSDFMSKEKDIRLKKWSFTDISESAYKANLYIDRLIEPTPRHTPENIEKELISFYNRCPSVLVIKLKKRPHHEK